MTGEFDNLDRARNEEQPREVEWARERFVAAWRRALSGGPVPELAAELAGLPPTVRSRARAVLGPIDQRFRRSSITVHPSTPSKTEPRRDVEAPGRKLPEVPAPHDDWVVTDSLAGSGFMASPVIPFSAGPGRLTDEWIEGDAASTASAAPASAGREEVPASNRNDSVGVQRKPSTSQKAASVPRESEDRKSSGPAQRAAWGRARVNVRLPAIPGYEIIGELGRGGMGVVYRARQTNPRRLVALKTMKAGPHVDAARIARFRAEALAAARLDHPGIVEIYEIGDHQGLPYFSLEFVEGGSLAERIKGRPQLPEKAAWIVGNLARAVAAAHAEHVVHRDLKPSNVLIGTDGYPKITDFGLAKCIEGDSNPTRTRTILGTPSYMAPEQARGADQAVGPAADQYALGAILYEMLTGRPPFQGATPLDTLEQVRTLRPVPPSWLQPKVPRDLETICLKALEKQPAQRYTGCDELAADLVRFLKHLPIRARPASRVGQFGRWCRRNPRSAALTLAALALTACLIIGQAATVAVYRQRIGALESVLRQADSRSSSAVQARRPAGSNEPAAASTLRARVSEGPVVGDSRPSE